MNPEVLNSWKEIAAYLGRGVRTVQRWEQDLALPVRRPRGKERSAVMALKKDLDLWLQSAPSSAVAHEEQPRLDHLQLRRNTEVLKMRAAELFAQSQKLQTKMAQSMALAEALNKKKQLPLRRNAPDADSIASTPNGHAARAGGGAES
jgi:hypothetical protein